ncbi:MAG: Zn-dependent exopeptidase M28, partial [Thermomicrobiales bacterium]|nr:Zn-dependent exopeptidase M28 [Thermomicrobiales bacterium]
AVNVVGEIAGRDPSKIYLLTAHFDSIASDTNDPAVAPGALDNGSGVAALIEAASVLARYELRHPVHIVFLNAEEVGLQGAQAFANRAVAEGRPYAAAFNVDAIGAPLATNRLIVNADAESVWIQALLVEINSLNGGLEIDLWPRQNPAIVADHTRLSQAGIPSVLLASVMYGDPLINQSNDTLDQVDAFRVQRITQLIVLTLGSLLM